MSTTKKKYTAEDKKAYADAKRAEQREMLAQAVEQLCTSDGWQQYLQTRARFHNYSFYNTILIALQCPEATQVAGAAKWRKEFNRLITEGQRAIKILAPQFVYVKDEAGKPKLVDGKKVIDYVWYKTVPVFDVSQTEGDPVPSVPLEPITGNSHEEYLYRAEQFAKGLGYTVSFAAMEQSKGGYCNPVEKIIVVNASREVNGQVRTLIHEIAHALGVDYTDYSRKESEVIVESAAYLTCLSVGLDTTGMSVPYIARWSTDNDDDPKAAMKLLKDFAGKIDEVAKTIEEGIS
jgi:hypothetical protein